MRDLRTVFTTRVDEQARKPTLRSLFAAKRDVCADPAGSLARLQPTWFFPVPKDLRVTPWLDRLRTATVTRQAMWFGCPYRHRDCISIALALACATNI